MIQNGQIEFPKKILIKDKIERNANGMLIYRGRIELILNRGGEKFSLEYIESRLKLKFDQDFVCVSCPDTRLGEELGIIVQSSKTSSDPAFSIQVYSFLKELFGANFSSDKLRIVDRIPMNESLKIDRKTAKKIVQTQL
jgi:non-ribosomal peptide synthetase component E (peptide arylation enzyme)